MPACGAFELRHYKFRFFLPFDDDVNVIRSHVDGQQTPIVAMATIDDPCKHSLSSGLVHLVRRLVHQAQFGGHEAGIRFGKGCSVAIVVPVDRAFGGAVHVGAVAREGDEIGHALTAPDGRGSIVVRCEANYSYAIY